MMALVAGVTLFERIGLRWRGLALVLRLPCFIRHAIDRLTALVLGQGNAFFVGGILKPVRQAVAAKARKIHQVDILHIGAASQMLHKTAKHGCLQFRLSFVVDAHDRSFKVSMAQFAVLTWDGVTQSAISPIKIRLDDTITSSDEAISDGWTVDTNETLREINNQLI
jgi:hypothetical protein